MVGKNGYIVEDIVVFILKDACFLAEDDYIVGNDGYDVGEDGYIVEDIVLLTLKDACFLAEDDYIVGNDG